MIVFRLPDNELRAPSEIGDPKFFPSSGFHRPIFETLCLKQAYL
jgi:hypothetical protein